jgi:hypothetical protein
MKHVTLTFIALGLVISAGILSFIIVPRGENLITGKATAMVYVYETPATGCAVNLTPGINVVSFYCESGEKSVPQAMINKKNQSLPYVAVYSYNPNNPLDAWASFNPQLPSWAVQQINNLHRKNGYIVLMNGSGEYYREGYRFSSTTINLLPGWNFIGYPTDTMMNITSALSQINDSYTRIDTYVPINGTKTWLWYIPPNNGTLSTMIPMVGYFIHMNESRSMTIDW